jgi:hypothetical protein
MFYGASKNICTIVSLLFNHLTHKVISVQYHSCRNNNNNQLEIHGHNIIVLLLFENIVVSEKLELTGGLSITLFPQWKYKFVIINMQYHFISKIYVQKMWVKNKHSCE